MPARLECLRRQGLSASARGIRVVMEPAGATSMAFRATVLATIRLAQVSVRGRTIPREAPSTGTMPVTPAMPSVGEGKSSVRECMRVLYCCYYSFYLSQVCYLFCLPSGSHLLFTCLLR